MAKPLYSLGLTGQKGVCVCVVCGVCVCMVCRVCVCGGGVDGWVSVTEKKRGGRVCSGGVLVVV